MKDKSFSDIVILAGGFGERLWPASRPDYPKQFMSLSGGVSFLQTSILRALALKPAGKIIIVTRTDLLVPASEHCERLLLQISPEDKKKLIDDLCIIAEPCPRHTTAPVLLSCFYLELLDSSIEHTILVLTSDHVIGPIDHFVSDSQKAYLAASAGKFVCYAIPPTEPATGYGYIKAGKSLDATNSVFTIDQFKEKPDLDTAKLYLSKGNYWWNSGMFAFTSTFMKAELAKNEPELFNSFSCFANAQIPDCKTINGIQYISDWKPMEEAYKTVPSIAIDNSVAEKTNQSVAVKATFDWDDVGSWDAFEKLFTANEGKTVEIQAKNNFVYSDIPVAICGVDNLVVVIKNGSALVMKKGSSALVREVVKQMKDIN